MLRSELAEAGIVLVDAAELDDERARLARASFPRFDLSGADAARHRSGASVPVHPQSRLHARAAAHAEDERPAHEGAGPHAEHARALHPAAVDRRRRRPLHQPRGGGDAVHPAAVPRLRGRRAGRLPRHPRLRHRGRGRGRGPRPLLRERAEAPPPRLGDPPRDRGGDAGSAAPARGRGAVGVGRRDLPRPRHAGARTISSQLVAHRPAGPEVRALHAALSRAHPRARRRLLRRHPPEGHHRPPPLRIVRRGGAVPAPGGVRSGRGGDQADALPHLQRLADRAGADRGGRGRQDR